MAQVLVTDVISQVAQLCRQCPTQTMVQAYIRAARKLCARSRWMRVNVTGSTIASPATEVYALGSDPYAEVIGIQAMQVTAGVDDIRPVTPGYSGDWDQTDDADVPEFYQYVPHGQFSLHPLADAVYPLKITLVLQPKRGVNSVRDDLVVKWDEALDAGTLAYLLKIPGMPWTDKNEANLQEAIFMDWINRATSAAQRDFNAGADTTGAAGQSSGPVQTGLSPI